jgi:hypothetical protein
VGYALQARVGLDLNSNVWDLGSRVWELESGLGFVGSGMACSLSRGAETLVDYALQAHDVWGLGSSVWYWYGLLSLSGGWDSWATLCRHRLGGTWGASCWTCRAACGTREASCWTLLAGVDCAVQQAVRRSSALVAIRGGVFALAEHRQRCLV